MLFREEIDLERITEDFLDTVLKGISRR